MEEKKNKLKFSICPSFSYALNRKRERERKKDMMQKDRKQRGRKEN